MRTLLTIGMALTLLAAPSVALAQEQQPPTPEQIQAVQNQANQAAGSASAYSGQASNLRAQASAADAQANAAAQQAAQLQAQAQQMRVDATNAALNTANQAKAKADKAAQKYAEAEALLAQANAVEAQATIEWKRARALCLQSVSMALQYATALKDRALTATQHQIGEAMLAGVVHEQRNTIAVQASQIETQNRLIIGGSLLTTALVVAIAWLALFRNQRAIDQLSAAFAEMRRSKRDDMAVVDDRQVRSYQILEEAAHGTGEK